MLSLVTKDSQAVEAGTVVKRQTGFGRDGFVAEVTVQLADGFATVRGEGMSPDFALARAKSVARSKLTARKRATGFGAEGFRTENVRGEFFGFAQAA